MSNKTIQEWKELGVKVHSTAILVGDIEIGEGTEIGALCYLQGPLVIGKNNKIYPGCIIGTEAEHKAQTANEPIIIGSNNTIRELTVIQRGSGERSTEIQNNCFIMDHCHIAHDVLLQDFVTVSPNVVFGGHTSVLEGATVGIGVATHQHSTIGAYAMIGMNSTVTKDVAPFSLVMGSPAKFARLNSHQFTKFNLRQEDFVIDTNKLEYLGIDKIVEHFFTDFNKFSKRK